MSQIKRTAISRKLKIEFNLEPCINSCAIYVWLFRGCFIVVIAMAHRTRSPEVRLPACADQTHHFLGELVSAVDLSAKVKEYLVSSIAVYMCHVFVEVYLSVKHVSGTML